MPKKTRYQEAKAKVVEFSSLEDGWLNGVEGQAIKGKDINWILPVIQKICRSIKKKFGVFPSEDGNIQLEWVADPIHITFKFLLSKKQFGIEIYKMGSNDDDQIDIYSSSTIAINQLLKILR